MVLWCGGWPRERPSLYYQRVAVRRKGAEELDGPEIRLKLVEDSISLSGTERLIGQVCSVTHDGDAEIGVPARNPASLASGSFNNLPAPALASAGATQDTVDAEGSDISLNRPLGAADQRG